MLRRIIVLVVILAAAGAAAIYWLLSGDAVRQALEQQASQWLGQPVRIASATAQIFPRIGIELRDVRVGEPARLTLAEVEVSTGLRALLSRRIEDAAIVVSDSRIEMPLALPVPAAAASAPSDDGGLTVASIREIVLRDIRLVSRGREIVVSADSSLTGSTLELSRFSATAGGTSLEASGVVELEPALDAKLQVTANELDLDVLLALADAFTPQEPARAAARNSAGNAPLVEGRIAATVRAERGRAAGVELRALDGNLVAQGNRVTLSPMSFELFGGRYDGSLEATVGNTLALTLKSRLENIDVGQLAAFGGVEGTVSGRLSGSGRFSGRGADIGQVLASAAGDGNATIADGTIRHLNLVRTVVLFFGRPAEDAPASQGNRFERITASFSLARQVVTAESFTMQSPDVDIAGSGTLTIPTKALDGRADLLLSESLSAQAGTDLVRYTRQGKRVVLPATVGGTLSAPRVMIDAAAAVKRGLTNEVERRLKGLLDRIKPPPP